MARPKGSRVIVNITSEPVSKPETVTLKITVPVEVKRVLQIEALGRDCSIGQVVSELVRNAPRRYVLQDRSPRPGRPEVLHDPDSPGALLVRGEPGPFGPPGQEVA